MNNAATMTEAGVVERRRMKWGLVFLGWAIIGCFFAGRKIASSLSRGRPTRIILIDDRLASRKPLERLVIKSGGRIYFLNNASKNSGLLFEANI